MWFFHHSPSGHHSLKGYLRSSQGCPSCSPLVLASLDGVEGVDEHPGVGVASSLLGSSLASSSTQGD